MPDTESLVETPVRPLLPVRVFKYLMNPETCVHRYIALLLICLLGFGDYFCYDAPGALEAPIEDALSIETSQFTSLYALYSWPNVIMCFVGGILIDKVLGIRIGSLLFLILLLIGQMMVAYGAMWGEFRLMQFGRFIYGLGGECLTVAQNTYMVAWFKGRELNTVFGLQITISRAGSTLAYNTMRNQFESLRVWYPPQTALGYTLMIANITCLISFVAALILAAQDRRAERILSRPNIQSDESISIKDITNFKPAFWMLTIICVSFYLTIFPLIAIGSKFFQQKWGYDPKEADLIVSTVYMISALTSPFIGMFVDLVGRNLVFLLVASILVTSSHTLFALSLINVWIPMIVLGIGYAIMCSALWPLVALVVPQKQLGTAYGAMQAFQNFGLALSSNLSGILIDWKGYITVELFFVLWVGICGLFSIVLMVKDNAIGGSLNRSAAERRSRNSLPE